MKITVLGASGKAGHLIVKELVNRGHDVTEVVRRPESTQTEQVIVKDFLELTKEDIAGADVLVSALGGAADFHMQMVEKFAELWAGSSTRLVMMGGAGSLFVNQEHSLQRYQEADFPEAFKETATAMAAALDRLRTFTAMNWVYVSPADFLDVNGPKTGKYRIAGEEMVRDNDGKSYISYEDYALGFVDIVEENHIRQRLSLVGE